MYLGWPVARQAITSYTNIPGVTGYDVCKTER